MPKKRTYGEGFYPVFLRLFGKGLSSNAKMLYGYLVFKCNGLSQWNESMNSVAKQIEIGWDAVRAAANDLIGANMIEVVSKKGGEFGGQTIFKIINPPTLKTKQNTSEANQEKPERRIRKNRNAESGFSRSESGKTGFAHDILNSVLKKEEDKEPQPFLSLAPKNIIDDVVEAFASLAPKPDPKRPLEVAPFSHVPTAEDVELFDGHKALNEALARIGIPSGWGHRTAYQKKIEAAIVECGNVAGLTKRINAAADAGRDCLIDAMSWIRTQRWDADKNESKKRQSEREHYSDLPIKRRVIK